MIIKRRVTKSFVTLENSLVRDKRLSLDEHGMLHYLLSLPPDWEVSRAHCAKYWGIGRDKVARIFKSLRRTGWAKVELIQAADGTILGKQWIIGDEPASAPDPDDGQDDDLDDADTEEAADPTPEVRPNHDTGNPHHGRIEDNIQTPPLPPRPDFAKLASLWPSQHILSNSASEKRFLRLSEIQQRQAIDRAKSYLADMANKGWKVCDLGTYLRERRFERLAGPSKQMTAIKPRTPQGFRWKEFLEATGQWTRYMQHAWDVGQAITVASEWPPAMPRGSPVAGAEFADEFDPDVTEPVEVE